MGKFCMRRTLLFAAITLLWHGFAFPQASPQTDAEVLLSSQKSNGITPVDDATLHSAYCIPIVQGDVDIDKEVDREFASKMETAQSARVRAQLNQLRETQRKLTAADEWRLSWLKARIPSAAHTEPAALAEATRRGEIDREKARTEAKQCIDKCFSATSYDGPKITACMHDCADPELHARIKDCETSIR